MRKNIPITNSLPIFKITSFNLEINYMLLETEKWGWWRKRNEWECLIRRSGSSKEEMLWKIWSFYFFKFIFFFFFSITVRWNQKKQQKTREKWVHFGAHSHRTNSGDVHISFNLLQFNYPFVIISKVLFLKVKNPSHFYLYL